MIQAVAFICSASLMIVFFVLIGSSVWVWLRAASVAENFSFVLALGIGALITIWVSWYCYRGGLPLGRGIAMVSAGAALSALTFGQRMLMYSWERETFSVAYRHAIHNWQYGAVFLFFCAMAAWILLFDLNADDLPLVTVGNSDVLLYIKSADFLDHSTDGNVLGSPWPELIRHDVFGAIVVLGVASFLTQLSPLQVNLVPYVAAVAILGTSSVWICRRVIGLPWISAFLSGLLILTTPLFSVVLFNYYLSQMVHSAALVTVIGALIGSQSQEETSLTRRSGIVALAFGLAVYGEIVLFTYHPLYFSDMVLICLFLFFLFLIRVPTLSFRYVTGGLFKSVSIVGLAISLNLLISPDRFFTVVNMALLYGKLLVGFPLPLFSAFSVAGLPAPFNASISTVEQGAMLFVLCLLFALVTRLTLIEAEDPTARLFSIVPFGLLIFLQVLYLAVWIYYGASYQQWKFASSYPLPFGFALIASCYAVFVSSLSKRIQQYANAVLVLTLIFCVLCNVRLSRTVWHGRVLHFPTSWQTLSKIDEIAMVKRVVVDLAEYDSRMAAALFIKRKIIVFEAATNYGSGQPKGDVSAGSFYLQRKPAPCAGPNTIPLGPFVLLSERMGRIAPRTPIAFSETITSCAELSGIFNAESFGRWTTEPVAKLAFYCSCDSYRPTRIVFTALPFLGRQRIEGRVNGIKVGDWTMTGDAASELAIPLPSSIDPTKKIELELTLPDSKAPAAVGGADIRVLGLALVNFRIE